MYALAEKYKASVYDFRTPEQLFEYLRNLKFITDVEDCNALECFKAPHVTARRGGDCDDKAIYAGSWFAQKNIPYRFVTVAYVPGHDADHVYTEFYNGNSWMTFDPTYQSNQYGYTRYGINKTSWNNPRRYNMLSGVPSEVAPDTSQADKATAWASYFQNVVPNFSSALKSGSAQTALFSTIAVTTGNPVVGVVAAVLVSVLTALGGKPGRNLLTPQDGYDISKMFVDPITKIFRADGMPEEGRKELLRLIQKYFDAMYAKYSTLQTSNFRYYPMFIDNRWANIANYQYQEYSRKPVVLAWEGTKRQNAQFKPLGYTLWNDEFINFVHEADTFVPKYINLAYVYLSLPITMVSQTLDVDDFKKELNETFIPKFWEIVANPFIAYAKDKMKLVISFYGVPATTNPPAPTPPTVPQTQATKSNATPIFIGAGLILLSLVSNK